MREPPWATATPSPERVALADELTGVLREHVARAWFPRCVDAANGGFYSDFDLRWRNRDRGRRMLEFQARQTRVCARLAIAFPGEGEWAEHALHGLSFMRDRMWDRQKGGWSWMTTQSGEPLAGATKHSHSGAYAVQTAALVFRATRESWALEHALEGLDWFDRQAWDTEFGGFHGWLTRDGEVISNRELVPPGEPALDPLGHALGLKDVNVQGDWFEALLDLAENHDSPRIRELRLQLGAVYLDRATTEAGEVHYAFHRNWMPQPGPEWYGYGFQAVHRFRSGALLVPGLERMAERADAVLKHTVKAAALRRGGFAYAGPSGPPLALAGHAMRAASQVWWVQFEALRSLALYAAQEESPGPYMQRLQRHWGFIRERLLDARYGGVFGEVPPPARPWARPGWPRQAWRFHKGDDWKDASHETDSLLMAIDALRGEPVAR